MSKDSREVLGIDSPVDHAVAVGNEDRTTPYVWMLVLASSISGLLFGVRLLCYAVHSLLDANDAYKTSMILVSSAAHSSRSVVSLSKNTLFKVDSEDLLSGPYFHLQVTLALLNSLTLRRLGA